VRWPATVSSGFWPVAHQLTDLGPRIIAPVVIRRAGRGHTGGRRRGSSGCGGRGRTVARTDWL